MKTFEGKFALYQRQLQDELSHVMREESNRVIDELNKGPHDKIKNKVRAWRRARDVGETHTICIRNSVKFGKRW